MQQQLTYSAYPKALFLALSLVIVLVYNYHVLGLEYPEERYLVHGLSAVFFLVSLPELVFILFTKRGRSVSVGRSPLGRSLRWLKTRTGSLMIGVAAYICLIPVLGFFVSTGLFLAVQSIVLGVRSIFAISVLEVFCLGATYLLLVIALGTRLPSGLLI